MLFGAAEDTVQLAVFQNYFFFNILILHQFDCLSVSKC